MVSSSVVEGKWSLWISPRATTRVTGAPAVVANGDDDGGGKKSRPSDMRDPIALRKKACRQGGVQILAKAFVSKGAGDGGDGRRSDLVRPYEKSLNDVSCFTTG